MVKRPGSRYCEESTLKLLKFGDYATYRARQVEANKLKFANVFAEDEELERIATSFAAAFPDAKFGLCHGVRNGYEVRKLRSLLPFDIQGTDISETAASIEHCMVWDMHEAKPEWIGRVDFMYSNSWDHTYDPLLLFSRWAECLSARGRLYITWTHLHAEAAVTDDTQYDTFGCSLNEIVLILQRSGLALEDVQEVLPRINGKSLRRRLSYLKALRFSKFFRAPLGSHRRLVLAFRKQ